MFNLPSFKRSSITESQRFGSQSARRASRRSKFKKMMLETLEARQLLTVFTWDGGGDGSSFADANNWSVEGAAEPATAPGAADDVVLDFDGGGSLVQVQVDADQQVASVTINSDDVQLRLNSGTFTTNTIDVDAGALVSVGGNIVANAITNNGTVATGRTQTFDVELIDNNGSFVIQTGATSRLTIDGTLRNSGVFSLNPSGARDGTLTVNNGLIVNEATGVITIGGIGSRTQTVKASFENAGELTFGGFRVNFDRVGDSITNDGALNFTGGVDFNTFDSAAVINQRSGSLLADGDIFLTNGQFNVSGGSVSIPDEVRVDNSGSISISGGSVVVDGRLLLNERGDFNFSGGQITGSEAVEVFGVSNLNVTHDGALNVETQSATTISGTLAFGQIVRVLAQNSDLIAAPGFVNNGTIVFINPGNSAQELKTADGGAFENAASGVLQFTRDVPSTAIATFIPSINNAGTIEVDAIVSDSKLNTLTNTGTFTVTADGRYNRSTAGSGTTGAFVQAGGILENGGRFDGGGLRLEVLGGQATGTFAPRELLLSDAAVDSGTFQPTVSLEGNVQAGQTVIVARDVEFVGDVSNRGLIQLVDSPAASQTKLDLTASTLTNQAGGRIELFAVDGESAFIDGAVINDGTISVQQGLAIIDGILNRGDVFVSADAQLDQRINSTFNQQSGRLENIGPFSTRGLFRYEGGAIRDTVTLDDTGSLDIVDGAGAADFRIAGRGQLLSNIPVGIDVTLSNDTGSRVVVSGPDEMRIDGRLFIGDTLSTGNEIEFNVANELTVGLTGVVETSTLTTIESRIRNEGRIELQSSATIGRAGESHANAGLLRLLNQNVSVIGLGLNNEIAGEIAGTGTLAFNRGDFTNQPTTFVNAGTINPGQSPGHLSFAVSQAQLDDSSVIQSEIGGEEPGTQFDLLDFSGALALGGLLKLNLINDFTPDAGSAFDLVDAAQISGTFSVIETDPPEGAETVWTFETQPEFVRARLAASAIDLQVSNIQAPTTVVPGEETTIRWDVTNSGNLPTSASFIDRIFVSPNAEFDIRTAQLVGTRTATSSVAPGETQQIQHSVPAPALVGRFFYHIISDSQQSIADFNRGNNIGCSDAATIFAAETVDSFNAPLAKSAVPGETTVVRFDQTNLSGPATMLVSSASATDIAVRFYFSQPSVNSESDFTEFCRTDAGGRCEIDVPADAPEVTFVSISFSGQPGTPPFTVEFEQSEPEVTEVSPSVVPNAGRATVTLSGSALPLGGTFELVGQDGTILEAQDIASRNSSQVRATYNFAGSPPQFYSFFHVDGGARQELCNQCFAVKQSSREANVFDALTPQFDVGLSTPKNVAALRESQVKVSLTNTFGVDLSGRLVQLETDNGFFAETGTPQMLVFLGGANGNVIAPGETASTSVSYIPTIGGGVNVSAALSTADEDYEVELGESLAIKRVLERCIFKGSGDARVGFESKFLSQVPDGAISFILLDPDGPDGEAVPVFAGTAEIRSDTVGSILLPAEAISQLASGRYDLKFDVAGLEQTFKNVVEIKDGSQSGFTLGRNDIFNSIPNGLFTEDERGFIADRATTSIGGPLHNLQTTWGLYNVSQVANGFQPATTVAEFMPGFAAGIVNSQLPFAKVFEASEGNIVVEEIQQRCITLDDLRDNPNLKIIIKGTGLGEIDSAVISNPNAPDSDNVQEVAFLQPNVIDDNTVELTFSSLQIERLLRNVDGSSGTRIALGNFDLVLGVNANTSDTEGPRFSKSIDNAVIIVENKAPDSQEPDNLRVAAPASFGKGNLDTTHYGRTQVSPTVSNYVLAGKDHFVIDVDGRLRSLHPSIYTVSESNGQVTISTTSIDEVTLDTTVWRDSGALDNIANQSTGTVIRPTTNGAGKITSLVNDDNQVVESYTRNADQQVTEIANANGTTTLSYNGQLLEAISNADRNVEFEYQVEPGSSNQRLAAIVVDGTRFTIQYSESGEIDTLTDTSSGETFDFVKKLQQLLVEVVGSDGRTFGATPGGGVAAGLLKGFAAQDAVGSLAGSQEILQEFGQAVAPVTTGSAIQTATSNLPGSGQQVPAETHNAVVRGTVAKNRSQASSDTPQEVATTASGKLTTGEVEVLKKVVNGIKSFAIKTIEAIQQIFANVLFSQDPNDILGPEGFGPLRHTTVNDDYDYTIRFENDQDATAPAQEVFVTQTLDDDFDLNSFEFDSFGWSGIEFSLPRGLKSFNRIIDLQPERNLVVRASGSVNPTTREVTWALQSLDPLTGSLPVDALNGFLPPNDDAGIGEGFVSYSVQSKQSLTTGTRLDAEASIVFDLNEAIITPPIFNTIDAGAPTATVNELAPVTRTNDFSVSWTGVDDVGGSGVATYDVFVSTDGGEFEPLLIGTTETSTTFTGEDGRAYAFRAVATDNVGFVESDPGVAESTTTVQLNSAPVVDSPLADVVVDEDADTQNIDLTSVFSDPDADALTFTATSTNGALVDVSIQADVLQLSFASNASGAATVTVTASDGVLTVSDTFNVTVNAVNDAPTVVNPLADVTVDEDAAEQTIDLTGVFADIDTSELTLSAVSSDGALVSTALDGNTLTLSFAADQNGAATVTVTASDGALSASDTFNVTVNAVNDAPTVVNPLPDVTVDEDAAEQTIDLAGVFADIDSSALTLSAVSSDGALVSTALDGNTLTLSFAADQNGAATVTVTASDGALTASDTFNVTVNAVNDAPTVVNPLPDVTVDEDAAEQTIDLTGVFADIDSSALTLSAVSSDGTLVSTTLDGSLLTLSFAADQNGAATVTVTASDGALTVSDTFNVTVNAVNDAPTVVNPLADVTVDEDAAEQTIDLKGVFADIDSSALTLSAVNSDGALVSTALDGNTLTLSFAADQNGAATVTVTASDGALTASDTFNVTVNAGNDAPTVINPLADVTVNEDAADQTIDLTGVFADIDTSELTLSAVSSDGSLVSTALDGSLLTLSFAADQNGAATVTVTASDGALTASDTFNVTVNAVNDAPTVVNPLPDVTVDEDAADQTIDLADVFADIDSLELTLSAVSSDGTLVSTTLDGSLLTLSFAADQNGAGTVTVTASDGALAASDTFNVTVNAVNDAPTVVNPLPDVTVDEDAADQTIDLADVFADIDSLELTLSAVSSDGTLVSTAIDGNTLTLSFAADQNGAATVTVTASDGALSASDTFNVTVNAVNDAPTVVNPLADVTVDEDAAEQTIDLADVFADIDTSALTLSAVSSDGSLVSTALDGSLLTLSFAADQNGAGTVTVTASDGALTASDTFNVTVNAVNDAPTVVKPLADVTVDEDAADQTIDLAGVFADIDSSALTLSAVSSDGTLVSTALDGSLLTLSFAADQNGAATVTVTASDGALTASDTFNVTVNAVNDAPTVVNPLADVTVDEDAAEQTIDLAGVFADIDSLELTLSAVSSDGTLVSTTLDGSLLTLSFAADQNGAATVTVTASDGALTASDTFNVTVNAVNDAPTVVNPLADVTVDEDAAEQTIDLADVFADIDSSALTLSAVSSDGTLVSTTLDGSLLTLSFAPERTGTTTITVTANDGEFSATDSFAVTVRPTSQSVVEVENGVLRITGDLGDSDRDRVKLNRAGSRIEVTVKQGKAKGQEFEFDAASINAVEVNLGDGDDILQTTRNFRTPIFVNGGGGDDWIETGRGDDTVLDSLGDNIILTGPGDDRIIAGNGVDAVYSGSGNDFVQSGGGNDIVFAGDGADIVVGGDGHDFISGGAGRDLLIGGLGCDIIYGGSGQDLIVGDATVHDNNDAALVAIASEWNSGRSLAKRKANIEDGSGSQDRHNGGYFLSAGDIVDDDATDLLLGGPDDDWKL